MTRVPALIGALAGLGLLLTACVPLATGPPSAEPEAPGSSGPTDVVVSELELHPYSTDGLEERIAGLHESSAAYSIRRGGHPLEDGRPGSEHVVLAERFSSSRDFALSPQPTGNRILVEIACSASVPFSFELLDRAGDKIGTGSASECPAGGPNGFGFGRKPDQHPERINVTLGGAAELQLGIVSYDGRG